MTKKFFTDESLEALVRETKTYVDNATSEKANSTDLTNHINNTINPHNVTKEQLDLGYVDNTADKDKSVYYALNADNAVYATHDNYGNMINTYYTPRDIFNAHEGHYDNPHGVTKEQIGLGNVENVSINYQTPTYEIADEVENLYSGEYLCDAMAKIAKVIEKLIGTENDEGILRAGETSITLGTSSYVDCTIDVYTDVYGVNPTNVVLNWDDNTNTGNVTVTFDPLDYDLGVKVRCF